MIRNKIGLDFAGEKYEGFRIHVADVDIDWSYATPIGQAYFFVKKGVYFGGQRLPGASNRFYFYILTPDENPGDKSHELHQDTVQKLVREHSGGRSG